MKRLRVGRGSRHHVGPRKRACSAQCRSQHAQVGVGTGPRQEVHALPHPPIKGRCTYVCPTQDQQAGNNTSVQHCMQTRHRHGPPISTCSCSTKWFKRVRASPAIQKPSHRRTHNRPHAGARGAGAAGRDGTRNQLAGGWRPKCCRASCPMATQLQVRPARRVARQGGALPTWHGVTGDADVVVRHEGAERKAIRIRRVDDVVEAHVSELEVLADCGQVQLAVNELEERPGRGRRGPSARLVAAVVLDEHGGHRRRGRGVGAPAPCDRRLHGLGPGCARLRRNPNRRPASAAATTRSARAPGVSFLAAAGAPAVAVCVSAHARARRHPAAPSPLTAAASSAGAMRVRPSAVEGSREARPPEGFTPSQDDPPRARAPSGGQTTQRARAARGQASWIQEAVEHRRRREGATDCTARFGGDLGAVASEGGSEAGS